MSGPSWADLEPGFRLWLLTTGYSPDSARLRLANMRLFAAWAVEHGVSIKDASHNDAASYLAEQLARVRQATAHSRLFTLRCFYRFCQAQGWRRDDPTEGIRIKRPRHQPKRPLSLDELHRLVGACVKQRDRAIILVLAATGARASELLHMEARDVGWEDGSVFIHGKGAKERQVSMGVNALAALRSYVNGHTGPLWLGRRGRPINQLGLRALLLRLGARAGVAPIGSHRLRTTFANDYLATGGDIGALQLLMGHADIAVTAGYAAWTAAERAFEHQRRFCLGDRL